MPRVPFGWKPQLSFDARDFIWKPAGVPAQRKTLLEHRHGPKDQGEVPCCVSAAISAAMEVLDLRANQPPEPDELSMLFNYYQARARSDVLSAITIRDGLQAAFSSGICRRSEHDVPATRAGAKKAPARRAVRDAAARKVDSNRRTLRPAYERMEEDNRVDQWRSALAAGLPIVVGIFITEGYERVREGADRHGDLGSSGASQVGHCVMVRGFDDSEAAFLVRDSFGTARGNQGEWWLPYELVQSPRRLVAECWLISEITF